VPTPSRHASELLLRSRRNAHVVATVSKDLESVIVETTVRANVDRPLGADGRRLAVAFENAQVGFAHDAITQRVLLVATAPNATVPAGTIALENALARCGPARSMILLANRAGVRLTGLFAVGFDLVGLIPTLPDPYATNFVPPREPGGATPLVASVRWTTAPQLSFQLPTLQAAAGAFLASTHATTAFRGLTLLDVSTNADQFGVQLLGARDSAGGGIASDGLALGAAQQSIAT